MYRALQRGASRRIQGHAKLAGMQQTNATEASSRESLLNTRAQVERGWLAAAETLDGQGERDLAWYVRRFIEILPPVRTDRELVRQVVQPRDHRPPQQELSR